MCFINCWLAFSSCSSAQLRSRKMFSKTLFINFVNFFILEISNGNDNHSTINMQRKSLTTDFQTIKLENGDFCFVTYFKDFKNIYLCGAVKNDKTNSYDAHNLNIILKTMKSTGQ